MFSFVPLQVPGKKLRVHCGSPSYAAPEIVSRQLYDGPPVDIWSLGVVLFAMITGYLPFHASGSNKDELCQKIIAGVYKTPDTISDESKDLLRGMLTTDPRRRLTLEQVCARAFSCLWALACEMCRVAALNQGIFFRALALCSQDRFVFFRSLCNQSLVSLSLDYGCCGDCSS